MNDYSIKCMKTGVFVVGSADGEMYSTENGAGGHSESLKGFIEKEDLDFSGYEDVDSYTLASYLASNGYLVDIIENYRNVVFLGKEVSENLVKWFLDNKKELRKPYRILGICSITDQGIEHYDRESLEPGERLFPVLRSLIKNKKVSVDSQVRNR